MPKRSKFHKSRLKYQVILIILISAFSFSAAFNKVQAQFAGDDFMEDASAIFDAPVAAPGLDTNQFVRNVIDPIKNFLEKAWRKGGSAALQTAIRTGLNKIAYDTATWIGSGGEGQKPLFVNNFWGYIGQVGDEAAGQFLESAVSNWQNADFQSDAKGSRQTEQCKLAYDDCIAILPNIDNVIAECKTNCAVAGPPSPTCLTSCEQIINTKEGCQNELIQCSAVITGSDGVTQQRQSGSSNLAPLVCRPSSLDARLRIAMALVDVQRPQAPNCTASEMIENWGDAYYRQTELFRDPNFLSKFSNIFNPRSNDLGIFYTLSTAQTAVKQDNLIKTEKKLIADGGWLDVRNIAGDLVGVPGDAERKVELAGQGYISNFGDFTGDAIVDAANVFLNRLAVSLFNKKMSNFGKSVMDDDNINNPGADPSIRFGEGKVKESMAEIIKPNFSSRGDYNILVSLSTCRDRSNPGPTECVIDDRFMQGVTEKLTVAEAVKQGYLRGDWQFTTDFREGAYSLRNIQILRKYRIVPLSWEVAAQADNNATLMDLMSCFSNNDAYTDYSSNFNTANQAWCRGLVDPNWVLKAPLNYCSAQGFSSQILNISVIPSVYQGAAIRDEVMVVRADEYCGDDQTCIDENPDGSCEAYGHCLSERKTWNFNSPSCEPINNTCSTFLSADGKTVSYLENTLDYGDCTADSVGCRRYSTNGSYNLATGQVIWSANPFANAYFNNKLEACSAEGEGCQEMMRVQLGSALNLVMGADFAGDNIGDRAVSSRINNYWTFWSNGTRSAEIIDANTLDGNSIGKAIRASSTASQIGLYSDNAMPLIPANFNVSPDQIFTLSADVYLITGDKVHAVLGGDYAAAVQTTDKEVWRHLSVTRDLKEKPLSELSFQIIAYSENGPTEFAVRNVKLEMNSYDTSDQTGVSNYGAQKIYQKLIPNYLKDTCYQDANSSAPNYRLKVDAPELCSSYARECNLDEAGCDRYSQVKTGFSVAAQAITTDYCRDTCDGYNLYISRANYFYSPQAEKMIPQNSRKCSAAAVGCSEFTNLDEVASGGENKEYYAKLKQCIKPGGDCADFYHWVGTEESGYQLKSVILKKDANGNPASTSDASTYCNEAVFNLPPSDPFFNPDCREYYNKSGQISYRLTANTITCSENCHNYRLSESNVDTTVSQAACVGTDRSWDTNNSSCFVCKNGGTWSDSHQACLYQGIPSESTVCQAAQNGCREYNGSLGNNTRFIFSNSFDYGLEGWEGQCGDTALHSPVANSNNGQSMMYDRGANSSGSQGQIINCDQNQSITWLDKLSKSAKAAPESFIRNIVGNSVKEGKSYSLKFTASASSNTNVYVAFINSQNQISYFNASETSTNGNFVVTGNNEWKTYEINLTNLDHQVDAQEAVVIVADRDFYLDNIILTEISSRYYLIKNTSKVPDICYYDILDKYQGPDYNLGCSAYTNRFNNTVYLRQFNKLCQDSAVGCEMMINTANYDSFKGNIWKDANNNNLCDSNEPDCLKVDGDRFFYAIYDKNKQCNSADLGCSRLGEAASSAQNLSWSDTFKRNNPNKYDAIICGSLDSGCEAWNYLDGSGTSYFKNPLDNVCVYRNSSNPETPGKDWYKVPVMRCDLNNNGKIDGMELGTRICSSADDCAGNRPCIMDNSDYECPVSYFKTFGYGGNGKQLPVPSESAALCESTQSSCTEYIDPLSSFSGNLVRDPSNNANANAWLGLGWDSQQRVSVEANSLYIFSVNTNNSSLNNDSSLRSDLGVSLLQEDNNLSNQVVNELIIPRNNPAQRYIFHSRNNSYVTVRGANANHEIVLKKVIIDYQLKKNINKSECKVVDESNGCILFNERSVNGGQGLQSLSGYYNAAASLNGGSPVNCTTGNCDSNSLIKVRPDRTCSSWMDCKTYMIDEATGERTCYAIGECNVLDDQGNCINFIEPSNQIINQANNAELNRLTGYSVLDRYSLARMKEVGMNTTAHFNFESASPSLYCVQASNGRACEFSGSIQAESIINSPNRAPTDYPAEGRAYLQVMSGQMVSPHSVNSPITLSTDRATHYLNFLVNTKGSGAQAKVSVYKYSQEGGYSSKTAIASSTISANQGWERKVMSFSVATTTDMNINNKVVIFLSVENEDRTEERYVYFDDINIEPVLNLGDNNYIAKECRLYPTQDALSCRSVNSQVVQDGLLGYCLQHDPANKDVCLLWYPVDEISANTKSARSPLGYQGAFPLNYCTEANGNFELVEKRVAYFVKTENKKNPCPFEVYDRPYDFRYDHEFCASGYVLFYLDGVHQENNNAPIECSRNYWCVPELQNSFVNVEVTDKNCKWYSSQFKQPGRIENNPQALVLTNDAAPMEGEVFGGGDCGWHTRATSESDGWYEYDGLHFNEAKNANPAVRIFDYDHPTIDEDSLKLISSSNPEEVYYPTCNRFVQVVDSAGNNMAWASRVSKISNYPSATPLFFRDGINFYGESTATTINIFFFNKYGRNRELVPFGAATIPDNYNIFASPPIKLRNQYSSKIKQQAFAGRPYGCTGDSCNNIGYCSLNPNVYCILDTTDSADKSLINQRSCGSANGTCVRMWNGDRVASIIDPKFKADNILKNMFLSSYEGYMLATSTGTYVSDFGYTNFGQNSYFNTLYGACTNSSCHDSTNDSSFNTYWRYNLPIVNNIKVNDQLISNNQINVQSPGVYKLSFNTIIDKEQQPLKDLIINWGDGNVQNLVNQDTRPNANTPHVVYHYYSTVGNKVFNIKITDNWGLYWNWSGGGTPIIIPPDGSELN